jgi:xanthine dehydrogenase accessory factor
MHIKQAKIPVLLAHPQNNRFIFLEKVERNSILYIFRDGHISLDLAWMADCAGFEVIVVDDRQIFANRERFPMATDVRVVPYANSFNNIKFGNGDFVVIVTCGHLYDLEVLREVFPQSPEYIGMVGSRRKKGMIYEQLKKEGISQQRLDEVHAPVGLDIRAETPPKFP